MDVDVSKRAGEISPLWFGHNLEHTRSCVWQGLSAQLIRNRKFAGASSPGGLAHHWHRIGPKGCLFRIERAAGSGVLNMDGEAYTARFGATEARWDGTRQSQRIQSFAQGERCGIAQPGIPLAEGREYECRLALLSDRKLSVEVRFSGRGHSGSFTTKLALAPEGWGEHRFTFTSPVSQDDSVLEITFDGPGALWVGAVALLPADHFLGMRRDVIQRLKEISVPILRWPGGNFAGCYRWEDGLLPVDRRAPFYGGEGILPHTDSYDDHEVGTDEFVALCREVAAEPWLTINMGLEEPEEAAAWVEYCNGSRATKWGRLRAERGHPEPYAVRYWSLGNEMGYGHMRGPNTPRKYGEMARRCAEAMRKVDPSIILVASGAWWKEEWFQTVLAEQGDCFEHIAFHEYIGLMKEFAGEAGKEEFQRLAAAPRKTWQDLRQVRDRLQKYSPGGKFVGISFDEWNVWHAWFRVPGVVEGIHAAAMLSMVCREARKLGMTIGAYFEPVNEGAILVEPGSARLTPAGQVFRLFRAHQGRELIEVDPSGVPEGVDAVASVDGADGEVALTLVNKSPDESKEVSVSLLEAGRVAQVEGTVLTSANFLPESEFGVRSLSITRKGERTFSVNLPAHSVALVQVACSGKRGEQ
jgi:alpha-N-arabinofuranosidase